MKRTFLLLLSFIALAAHAQNYTKSEMIIDNGIAYNLKATVNLPHATPQLDSILCKKIFGTEGTLKEGFDKYFSKYDNTYDKPRAYVELYFTEEYYDEKSGMLCVSYVVPGEERVANYSKEKYVTYDLKNAKQVLLEDLINDELKRHLTSQGIDTKSASNIYTYGHMYIVYSSGKEIRMTPLALYKYMTDYGLGLAGMNRAEIEASTATEASSEDKIFDVPEKMASFPGGDEKLYVWIQNHIKYPWRAQEEGIQGRVMTKFVIEKDGSIGNVQVTKSPSEDLSREAIRVIKSMPNWIPASQGTKYVRSIFNFPVMFRLQ